MHESCRNAARNRHAVAATLWRSRCHPGAFQEEGSAMTQTIARADGPATAGHRELAGVLTQLLRRYAADIPAGQLNDVDRAVARGLDQIPDARRIAARMARRVLNGRGRSGVQ